MTTLLESEAREQATRDPQSRRVKNRTADRISQVLRSGGFQRLFVDLNFVLLAKLIEVFAEHLRAFLVEDGRANLPFVGVFVTVASRDLGNVKALFRVD